MAAHQWQRVAREITAALDSGEFKPGDQLPPRAVLARRWGVSAAVTGTAFDHLTAGGVLRHGQAGRYYAAGPGQHPGPAAGGQAPAFLTVAEVAAQARVSKATIYRLIRDGTIRSARIGSNRRIDAGSWYARFNRSRLPARHALSPRPAGPVRQRSRAAGGRRSRPRRPRGCTGSG
jgi:excisionase family DNA binding protein